MDRRQERNDLRAAAVPSLPAAPVGTPLLFRSMTTPADDESTVLLQDLLQMGVIRDAAITRLHALLLRVARAEANRRRGRLPDRVVEEVDDLCVQAANDAVMNILRKLDEFRGTARFTTWACKFVIFEVSTRLRRHAWRHRPVETSETVWGQLPDLAPSALHTMESQELTVALQRAVRERLTDRQRTVFQAATIDEIPIDVLAERYGSSRGAIYKTLHDARRKLRDALTTAGYAELLA
jgi:RNA polymerase sigma-70 factor (ECF subfamily)